MVLEPMVEVTVVRVLRDAVTAGRAMVRTTAVALLRNCRSNMICGFRFGLVLALTWIRTL